MVRSLNLKNSLLEILIWVKKSPLTSVYLKAKYKIKIEKSKKIIAIESYVSKKSLYLKLILILMLFKNLLIGLIIKFNKKVINLIIILKKRKNLINQIVK